MGGTVAMLDLLYLKSIAGSPKLETVKTVNNLQLNQQL